MKPVYSIVFSYTLGGQVDIKLDSMLDRKLDLFGVTSCYLI